MSSEAPVLDRLFADLQRAAETKVERDELRQQLDALRKDRDTWRARAQRSEDKVSALEKKRSDVVSPGDELWLRDNDCEVRFKRYMEGDSSVTIRSRGRTLSKVRGDANKRSLLARAVKEAQRAGHG